jgi:hypothetical protein
VPKPHRWSGYTPFAVLAPAGPTAHYADVTLFRVGQDAGVPAQAAPPDVIELKHVDRLLHEIAAPTSVETRDLARALRDAGYEVTIGSPQTLTEPWLVTASEPIESESLSPAELEAAVARVRRIGEEQGGNYLRSATHRVKS